jgi:hypothetical protein
MIQHRGFLVLVLCVVIGTPSLAGNTRAARQTVSVEGGNIVLATGAAKTTLTSLKRDSEAVLSPDGAWVLYTRAAKPVTEESEYDDCTSRSAPDELRRIKSDGSGDELLLTGEAGDAPEDALCGFQAKQFTSDGATLYFLSPAWTTSSALHAFDLTGRTARYVMPANDLLVLSWCTAEDLRDALIVQQHRYFRFGGSYDWYWLYDRSGVKEIGPVGEQEDAEAVKADLDASGQCAVTP